MLVLPKMSEVVEVPQSLTVEEVGQAFLLLTGQISEAELSTPLAELNLGEWESLAMLLAMIQLQRQMAPLH
jgi:hypothetical protein